MMFYRKHKPKQITEIPHTTQFARFIGFKIRRSIFHTEWGCVLTDKNMSSLFVY